MDFSQISIEGLDDSASDPGPGLRFVGQGALAVTATNFLDLRFGFSVSSLDPARAIVDASLEILEGQVKDRSLIELDETILDASRRVLGTTNTAVDSFFGQEVRFDAIDLPPQRKLFVEKDLFLDGWTVNGAAELAEFTQRFSQVPEPGQWALLAASFALLGAWREARNRSNEAFGS